MLQGGVQGRYCTCLTGPAARMGRGRRRGVKAWGEERGKEGGEERKRGL